MAINLGALLGDLVKIVDAAQAAGVTLPSKVSNVIGKVGILISLFGAERELSLDDAVKAEIEKLLAEAKAEEPAIVAEVEALLDKLAGKVEAVVEAVVPAVVHEVESVVGEPMSA